MIKKRSILILILFFYKLSFILGRFYHKQNQYYKLFVIGIRRHCEFKLNLGNDCSPTEYCDEETKECQCFKGYERINDTYCVISKTDQTSEHSNLIENGESGSATVYILTPLILIIFVICGIYLNRRYQLVAWVNKKIHRNHGNYDEFMIGQDFDDDDDPPLR